VFSDKEEPTMRRIVKEFLLDYQDPLLHILKTEFPELVPNDQVSVYGASLILYTFIFIFFHQTSFEDCYFFRKIFESRAMQSFNLIQKK